MIIKKHLIYSWSIIFSALATSLSFGQTPLSITNAAEARVAMEKFITLSGKSVDKYDIYINDHPGLLKETYIATIHEKGNFIPVPPPRYIIFKNNEIAPLDLEKLVIAYGIENIAVSPNLDIKTIATSLINLVDNAGPIVISKPDDIPGYKKHPVDTDLESIIKAPWEFKDSESNIYWICNTYTRNQGIVRRYKFVFRQGHIGNPVDVIQLGSGIGNVIYPE